MVEVIVTPPLLPMTVMMTSMTQIFVGRVWGNDGWTASSSNKDYVVFDVLRMRAQQSNTATVTGNGNQ